MKHRVEIFGGELDGEVVVMEDPMPGQDVFVRVLRRLPRINKSVIKGFKYEDIAFRLHEDGRLHQIRKEEEA